MKRRCRIVVGTGLGALLALVLIMVCGPLPRATAEPPSTVDPATIDAFLSRAREATRLPGLAVAVVRRDEVVHVAGYGRDGAGAPVTGRTPFRIASLSKSFTAVAVHRLAAAGRLDLGAPVRRYLPDFGLAGRAEPIRIRDLLQQRSGLADSGYPGLLRDQPRDPAERVRLLHGAEQVDPPGTQFHYTDLNYQVLARLIEVITGLPYDRYLTEQVIGPLGLTGTSTATTSATPVPGLTSGHLMIYGEPVARPEQTGLLGGDGLLAGSSGVVSTADDLARWLRFNLGDGAPLLSRAALTELHTPASPNGYAEGWQLITPAHGPRRLEHRHPVQLLGRAGVAAGQRLRICPALQRKLDGGRHRRDHGRTGRPADRGAARRSARHPADRVPTRLDHGAAGGLADPGGDHRDPRLRPSSIMGSAGAGIVVAARAGRDHRGRAGAAEPDDGPGVQPRPTRPGRAGCGHPVRHRRRLRRGPRRAPGRQSSRRPDNRPGSLTSFPLRREGCALTPVGPGRWRPGDDRMVLRLWPDRVEGIRWVK
ncbi:serine hydrolase domain-containing protein [Microlunatus speluncae]|uniref:serine hydrolase domain-containing protein n=1 Tax=Microlunatus speluncae TaxID=2594267 RepID=UPI0012665894|nr:serine hydrolase domain-containing protein [Microlunatus speluncae]